MKKMMICINLNDHSMKNVFEYLKHFDWTYISELHLIHGFKLQRYSQGFYLDAYPIEETYQQIKDSAINLLGEIEKEIFKGRKLDKKPTLIKECFITGSPKDRLTKYSNDEEIDIVLIATRNKHGIKGFFTSSFAHYMVSHAKAELRIIRSE